MAAPVIFGPAYSTYTRTVRLALEEKGVEYKLDEVDILQGQAQKPDHVARHPFAKVPAFAHDGMTIYETSAIARYVDEAFPGPKLQPADAKVRARMNQIIAVVDSYAYGAVISKLVIQRLVHPLLNAPVDEKVIADAMPMVEKSAAALEALADSKGPYLCGAEFTLADCFLVPVMGYFAATPESKKVLGGMPRLSRWWQTMSSRPSVVKTQPKLG